VSLGWKPLVIAVVVVALLNLYNAKWSRLPGLGNLAVSFMGALPIIYGGASTHPAASSRLEIPAAAALVAFWLHLARELLKDTVDIDGDLAAGRRTLPILHGPVAVMRVTALTMLIAAVCAFWLGTTGWFTSLYMFGICVTVLPALLYGAAQCWLRPEQPIAARWTAWLKVIMLAGLVWMVLSMRIP
jgi:geranylgeranylglycerol-phosphate geranylgeranyltransferase